MSAIHPQSQALFPLQKELEIEASCYLTDSKQLKECYVLSF